MYGPSALAEKPLFGSVVLFGRSRLVLRDSVDYLSVICVIVLVTKVGLLFF